MSYKESCYIDGLTGSLVEEMTKWAAENYDHVHVIYNKETGRYQMMAYSYDTAVNVEVQPALTCTELIATLEGGC